MFCAKQNLLKSVAMQDFRNAKKKMVRKIYVFEAQKDVSKFKSIFKYYILEIKKIGKH